MSTEGDARKIEVELPSLELALRGNMEFLASDAMGGRGSETRDELIAATYVASRFREFGLEPGGDDGGYIQKVQLEDMEFKSAPALSAGGKSWTHGTDIAVYRVAGASQTAPLQKLAAGQKANAGSAAFVKLTDDKNSASVRDQLRAPCDAGAAMLLVAYSEQLAKRFQAIAKEMPSISHGIVTGEERSTPCAIVFLGEQASTDVAALPDGTSMTLAGEAAPPRTSETRNVIGILRGTSDEALLLGAHVDHLGTDPSLKGDQIFNGADDDASGVATVIELARVLSHAGKPRRTIYFIGFGDEEKGGYGGSYFIDHTPVPLDKIVAELEFEMLGRRDDAVKPEQLWLTGWERTNLGPELAGHGAKLVGDPHPAENFFMRSDNYALAKKGVVAQTVSSFGLHGDYHRPSDEVSKIDFAHMAEAVKSMLPALEWLANSNFVPQWKPGKKP